MYVEVKVKVIGGEEDFLTAVSDSRLRNGWLVSLGARTGPSSSPTRSNAYTASKIQMSFSQKWIEGTFKLD
jgi:hypothetical protein